MDELIKNQLNEQLFAFLATLDDPDAIEAVLTDICTEQEVHHMAQRLECAKLLMDGKTYEEVIAMTEISSATLSRVSRSIRHGTGYSRLFKEYLEKK